MRVNDIDLPPFFQGAIREMGIEELYPPQAEAMPHVLRGDNVLMAVPTAAGKSLVAYVAALRAAVNGGKTLYIVPLRSLAWEKLEDLKRFEKLGVKIGVSVGDFDAPARELSGADIIVATAEKADSILRHREEWLRRIKVVVADEVHLIQDAKRGPILEVILARFKGLFPECQIIGLSATVPNSEVIAEWLNAAHVKSDWRPVPLETYVYCKGKVFSCETAGQNAVESGSFKGGKGVAPIVIDSLEKGHQCLIFVSTRRSSVSVAKKVSALTERYLSDEDREALKEVSRRMLEVDSEITDITKELAELLEKGASYHNAGLTNGMRREIEGAFREGKVKMIAATPTLAAGVNLPARRVIVRDVYRYEGERGMVNIPCLEVKQMCGRAGRPSYDTRGEAFIRSSSRKKIDDVIGRYILSKGEPIESKMGAEGVLRTHVLSSIASGFVRDVGSLEDFIDSTLFAHQADTGGIQRELSETVDFLLKYGFIEYADEEGRLRNEPLGLYGYGLREQSADTEFRTAYDVMHRAGGWRNDGIEFCATDFGHRTSQLYIDPMSALNIRNALDVMEERDFDSPPLLGVLHTLCSCPDMHQLYLRKAENREYTRLYFDKREEFLISPPSDPFEFEFFLSEIKSAALLRDWIVEKSADLITKKYNIGPGDIRTRVELGEWLLYSMRELAKLIDSGAVPFLKELEARISYGIEGDLIDLVKIRNVGRVRARTLFEAGYEDRDALREAEVENLRKLRGIGDVLAEKILARVREE